jgi:uncharacterized protein (DUF1501 family)
MEQSEFRNIRRICRRTWLRLGALGGLSLGFPIVRAATAGSLARSFPGFGRAKSVILVFANGGQSQLDTWDPKPAAPAEIRGEFKAIRTSVPGVMLSEHMPKLARLADRYTIVRSMNHDDLDHGSAAYLALTGRFHARKSSNPPPEPTDFPTYGAALKRVRPNLRFPYTSVHVNGPALVPERVAPGQFGGFLGREYEPLVIGDVTEQLVAVPGLEPSPEVPPERLAGRRRLLQAIEVQRPPAPAAQIADMNVLYQQAFQVLASPTCRSAFDLSAEPERLRERYGRYRSGQACLLARRLVEAKVPLVTVMFNHGNRGQDKQPEETEAYGWDTHNDIFHALKVHLLPRFDQSFSALLEDLEDRGLLDETLVICMGEFGRAPRVALEATFAGTSPGRKHWASAYSIVMAGAGVTRGATYGDSDQIGAHVKDRSVSPADIAATMFAALGIDPASDYVDSLGRPFALTEGKPIDGLFVG